MKAIKKIGPVDLGKCPCGVRIVMIESCSDRAITVVSTGVTEYPVIKTCADGHEQTVWVVQ